MNVAVIQCAWKAPGHPALRWSPIDELIPLQHRRNKDGTGTVCGIIDYLTLAEPGDAQCEAGCWE